MRQAPMRVAALLQLPLPNSPTMIFHWGMAVSSKKGGGRGGSILCSCALCCESLASSSKKARPSFALCFVRHLSAPSFCHSCKFTHHDFSLQKAMREMAVSSKKQGGRGGSIMCSCALCCESSASSSKKSHLSFALHFVCYLPASCSCCSC